MILVSLQHQCSISATVKTRFVLIVPGMGRSIALPSLHHKKKKKKKKKKKPHKYLPFPTSPPPPTPTHCDTDQHDCCTRKGPVSSSCRRCGRRACHRHPLCAHIQGHLRSTLNNMHGSAISPQPSLASRLRWTRCTPVGVGLFQRPLVRGGRRSRNLHHPRRCGSVAHTACQSPVVVLNVSVARRPIGCGGSRRRVGALLRVHDGRCEH